MFYGLCNDKADKRIAIELAKDLISRGRHSKPYMEDSEGSTAVTSPASSKSEDSEKRMAHNVTMRLKDTLSKFNVKLEETLDVFVDNYFQLAKDNKLRDEQNLQYLHNLLCKDSLHFQKDTSQPHSCTFEQDISLIGNEYDTPVWQSGVKNYLYRLGVSVFVKEGMDVTIALSKLHKTILTLSRQGSFIG